MTVKDRIELLAVIATALGWGVGYLLSTTQNRKLERMKASLKFLETQLAELYGPLVFLVREGQRAWNDFFDTLETLRGMRPPSVFPLRDDEELRLWLFWVDNVLLPRNESIRELLMSKTHLVEGPSIPTSYLKFLEHHNSWKTNHLRWKKEKVKYSWHSKM